jgi:NAD-dependent deacetylase
MEEAIAVAKEAEIFLIIGTSLVVYPAAGLVNYVPWEVPKYIIDKKIPYASSLHHVTAIEKPATEGMKELVSLIKKEL